MIGQGSSPVAVSVRDLGGPNERRDTFDGGGARDPTSTSRRLASRLIAGLDDRPLRPTADQLAWVWGGDLVRGETRAARARMAAGRYAALLADHVIGDMTADGAPAAYARIWRCARSAFIASTAAESREAT